MFFIPFLVVVLQLAVDLFFKLILNVLIQRVFVFLLEGLAFGVLLKGVQGLALVLAQCLYHLFLGLFHDLLEILVFFLLFGPGLFPVRAVFVVQMQVQHLLVEVLFAIRLRVGTFLHHCYLALKTELPEAVDATHSGSIITP